MPRTTRTTAAAPSPCTPQVMSEGAVVVDDSSAPTTIDATVTTTVHIGRQTYRATYSAYGPDGERGGNYFDIHLSPRPGEREYCLLESDGTRDWTPDDVRALATALDAIATEIERKLPPLRRDAARIVDELRGYGLRCIQ